MPRFNDAGTAVTPQIGYSWYDQSRFIFQDCSSGVCRVALSDGTTIAETGVVRLLGNGHRVWAYVEFTPGIDPTQAVYRDSFGRTRINEYPQAISPDGAICVKPHSNIGATVLDMDGRHEWALSEGDAQDIQLLDGYRWIWTIGGIVHSNFPIIGNPGVPVWWPRVADDGTLLYQHQGSGALILGGKVIGPPSPRYFYPDVRLNGDVYHVTWSPNQADTDAQFLQITRAELAALPAVRDVRTPVPDPRTPTTPEPEPEPVSDELDIIRVIRTDYPTPLGARHWEFLVEVAQTLDVQLYRKEDNNSVLIPALGKRVSLDVIGRGALGDRWADILQDSEGLAIPVWQIHDGAGGEYVDVSQVELPGAHPEPQPQPEPGRTLEQRVEAIEAWIRRAL